MIDAVTAPLPTDRDAAITHLFATYHRQLVGFAVLLADDLATAEDIVQDAFLALHRRWSWMRDPQAAYEYLRVSVLNGYRNQLRRRRLSTVRRERPSAPAASAEAVAFDHVEQDEVAEQLATLPARQREVLVLRYYLDQTEAEIARTLSISPGSVKQHAARGLAALTARLEAST